jgi:hypothetical protein
MGQLLTHIAAHPLKSRKLDKFQENLAQKSTKSFFEALFRLKGVIFITASHRLADKTLPRTPPKVPQGRHYNWGK